MTQDPVWKKLMRVKQQGTTVPMVDTSVQPPPTQEPAWKKIMRGKLNTPAPQPPQEPAGVLDQVGDFFTGNLRETEQTRNLPELASATGKDSISTGEFGKDLQVAAGLMLSHSTEARKDIIKEHFGDQVKFTEDQHGTTVITFPDGKQAVLNKPGMSFQDIYSTIGEIAMFAGPSKFAAFGKGIWTKAGIEVAAAATTEAAREKGIQSLGSKQEVDPLTVGVAGVIGGVASAVPNYIGDSLKKRAARLAGADNQSIEETLTEVAKANQQAKHTGIDFSKPQKTGNKVALEDQKILETEEASQAMSKRFVKLQNKQSEKATDNVLESLGSKNGAHASGSRLQAISKSIIAAKKEDRDLIANPLYEKAFTGSNKFTPKQTHNLIDHKMVDMPESGEISRSLSRINDYLGRGGKEKSGQIKVWKDSADPIKPGDLVSLEKGGGRSGASFDLVDPSDVISGATKGELIYRPVPTEFKAGTADGVVSLRRMHNAKREIDLMLERTTDNVLGRETKLTLEKVKQSLLREMDSSSKDYGIARRAYAKASGPINQLESTYIGQISKLKEIDARRAGDILFDPKEPNSRMVEMAKREIESVDPQAWRDIVRSTIEKRIGKVKFDEGTGGKTTENIPGQLYRAMFPNRDATKALLRGVDFETRKNLLWLKGALRRAGEGRGTGSQTYLRSKFDKRVQKYGVGGGILNFYRELVLNPVQKAGKIFGEIGEATERDYRVMVMAEAIFNTKWQPDMKAIRSLDPESKRAGVVFKRLLDEIAKPSAQTLNPMTER